jgi:hypothetical protein
MMQLQNLTATLDNTSMERSLQMTNILKQHFPMLREREDILGEIDADKKLSETVCGFAFRIYLA